MDSVPPKVSDVRYAAMSFLAMREHSAKELRTKLERKYPGCPELTDSVVELLAAEGLQSDERFTEAFILMRQRQGKGSQVVRLGLRERGIDAELISRHLDESGACWLSLVVDVRRKRFGLTPPKDSRERARQERFLRSRGFSGSHVRHAFGSNVD